MNKPDSFSQITIRHFLFTCLSRCCVVRKGYSAFVSGHVHIMRLFFIRLCGLLLLFTATIHKASAQCCIAIDNTDITQSLLNTYFPITGNLTVLPGTISLPLAAVPPNDPFGNSYGTTPISPGDLLLVIQVQDADFIAQNNVTYGGGSSTSGPDQLGGSGYTSLGATGTYEFVIAANSVPLTGGILLLDGECANGGLVHGYRNQDATASSGQRRFQVVRVPRFNSLQLTSNIIATAWNGRAGGVVALHIADTLNLNGFAIDASGTGFRGGYQNVQPSGNNITDYMVQIENLSSGKGEGIAGTPRYMWDGQNQLDQGPAWLGYPGGDYGRGAPGNAGGGGNDHNAGGGGGGGGGSGGVGGNAVNSFGSAALPNGGRPGIGLSATTALLIPGGGGGGGDANNALTGIKGGVGGGIILITAGTLAGSGVIRSNGTAGQAGVFSAAPDGAGGGGAGGTIVIEATQSAPGATLSIEARGGNGGHTINDINDPHGPGGGGGGGIILHQLPGVALTTAAPGGLRGQTNSGAGTNWGSAHGQNGVISTYEGSVFPDDVAVILFPKPSAAFAPAQACVNAPVTFTDASSVTAILSAELVSWSWLFDDGTEASGTSVTHVFTTPGMHDVRLVVRTNHDCADTLIQQIEIFALPEVQAGDDVVLCAGDWVTLNASGAQFYLWTDGLANNEAFQPETGVYVYAVTGTDPNGCSASDSLEVVVNPHYEVPVAAFICDGQGYTIGSQTLTDEGEYEIPLVATSGCDSLVVLSLAVFQHYETSLSALLCEGESLQVGGQSFFTPGDYDVMLSTVQGCDSLVHVTLAFHPVFTVDIEERICPGASFELAGNTFGLPGSYLIPLQTVSGCDSLLVLDLSLFPQYEEITSVRICADETFEFEGSSFSQSGLYSIPYQTIHGCDSLRVLDLVVDPVYEIAVFDTLCAGATYAFDDLHFSESGSYEIPLVSSLGCDSLIVLHLEALQPYGTGFYFPNVFTPNGDGLNEEFRFGGKIVGVTNFSIQIFNRWGSLMYESSRADFRWDGRTGDRDHEAGVYYYISSFRHPCGQREYAVQGYFTLIRD